LIQTKIYLISCRLGQAVGSIFDNVMVMADDEAVKQNRLALLSQLSGLFLDIADISVLQK